MKKFVVNQGKKGYNFATIADTEEGAKDLAWKQENTHDGEFEYRREMLGPFAWWQKQADQWGNDKWYVVELSITQADKHASASVGKQEHDVVMNAITGRDQE